jgi:hypothetical protein
MKMKLVAKDAKLTVKFRRSVPIVRRRRLGAARSIGTIVGRSQRRKEQQRTKRIGSSKQTPPRATNLLARRP